MVGYVKRNGEPNRARICAMAKAGLIPGPIDPSLRSLDWRWARREIEAYCAGDWKRI